MRTTRNSRAFTIVELLLFVLIMGIVAMMVGPATQSLLREARLNATAGEVAGALEYARGCAVRYQRPFAVGWIPQRNVIAVQDRRFRNDNNVHPDEDPAVGGYGVVFNPFDKKPYTLVLGDAQNPGAVRPGSPPEDLAVVFYPEGHASPADVALVLILGNLRRTITVSAATGRVTVSEY